ncbi:MAG: alpha/beta hydrolase, partial [Pseudomonadota bacterium]
HRLGKAMGTISANGIDLYHEIHGQGPRLLFISGTGGDLRVRPNVFDGPLPAAFEVLAYDQRGLGQSVDPALYQRIESDKEVNADRRDGDGWDEGAAGDYGMGDYADDAAGLLDALGWDGPVLVMGVSFGGMVAQEFALKHPERVRALVLACTSAGGAGGASYPLHELEALADEERAARHLELADTRRDAAWRAANPDKWQTYLTMAQNARRVDRDEDGARRQLQARAGHDTFERLAAVQCPVLLAGGRYDGIAPMANMEALASRLPEAELEFFDGGHLFFVQDKKAYPRIVEWLSAQAAG